VKSDGKILAKKQDFGPVWCKEDTQIEDWLTKPLTGRAKLLLSRIRSVTEPC
jgi:hypothetical protein